MSVSLHAIPQHASGLSRQEGQYRISRQVVLVETTPLADVSAGELSPSLGGSKVAQ